MRFDMTTDNIAPVESCVAAPAAKPRGTLRTCVIIPTKNRPDDLELTVQSLLAQTLIPESLLIVDQSDDEESRRRVETALSTAKNESGTTLRLRYIHDRRITGGAMARNRAMSVADGDVWVFLDDDVYLETDFIEQLLAAYRENPRAGGISGVITNYPHPAGSFKLWDAIFVRGPFRDERQPVYWNADRLRNSPPVRVRRFGGGLMSFYADIIRGMSFDENLRGVSDGEDVDFCTRLKRGTVLLIAPRARLEHKCSPIGRLRDHWLRRSVRASLFLYEKNWNHGIFNRLCRWWLLAGYFFVVAFACVRRLSLGPWEALRTGMKEAKQTIR
jgi:GT2 family glycosyltransferase